MKFSRKDTVLTSTSPPPLASRKSMLICRENFTRTVEQLSRDSQILLILNINTNLVLRSFSVNSVDIDILLR